MMERRRRWFDVPGANMPPWTGRFTCDRCVRLFRKVGGASPPRRRRPRPNPDQRRGQDDPFNGRVEVHGLDDDMDRLVASLRGAEVLYNTYWVRYNKKEHRFAHNTAVENTRRLFEAAKLAGVKHVVHFSVANPTKAPNWTYFEGKVKVEAMLKASGLSYAILRPTVLFGGHRNVLINNIAWMLRRFPVFGVFGLETTPSNRFTSKTWRKWPSHRGGWRRTPWSMSRVPKPSDTRITFATW